MSNRDQRLPAGRSSDLAGIVPFRDFDQASMLYSGEFNYEEAQEESFDFWSLVRILLARKWMILAIAIVGVAASFALTLRVVPMYFATATIEVQRPEAPIIEGTNVGTNIVGGEKDMETLYRLLKSRFLAERVAEDLNLSNDPRYANPALPRDRRVLQAAGRVVSGLSVYPSGESRVVNVRYTSPYPQETARIANAVVESFIQSNLERKYNTTAYAREFLDERLAATKRSLEDSERNLVRYAEDQDILDIGSADGGGSLNANSIVALNNELSQAESERIRAEQAYRAANESESYRELLESEDLKRLREQRASLLLEYEELRDRFKPDYPDMVKLQTRIDAVDVEMERESLAIITALNVDYEAAVAREASLRSRVAELRVGLQDDRNRRIEYTILQREVETLRSQYQALLQRSKEVSIASGIGSSNVSVVDAALVPGAPFLPNINQSVIRGLMMSLACGIGLAFLLHFIDDTIQTPDDLRTKLGLSAIGVVPKLSGKKDAIVRDLEEPKSRISEAFASARTALEFSTEEGAPRSLLITSTRPGEGKTSTTIALATIFAKGGSSVLIIDADMRKPSFITDAKKSIGLSGLLTSNELLQDQVVRSTTEGLSILPSGVIPPNPAQLLSGSRLREIIEAAENMFDLVIVDSPPVLSFTDSPRLGSVVQGALMVIQSGAIRTPAAKRTMSQLYEARTNVVGAVLTKFDAKKAGQEYSYYYSSYGQSAYAYVENNSRGNKRRKILIEAAPDKSDSSSQYESDDPKADESKRWSSY